jgi:hypothetical protein
MQKWEYIIDQVGAAKDIEVTLNKRGGEGWELVAVTVGEISKTTGVALSISVTSPLWTMYFKRPIPEP